MTKADALSYFRTAAAIARRLNITRSAVSQWGPVVPYFAALDLQHMTGGALKVDFSLYDRGRPLQVAEQAKAA